MYYGQVTREIIGYDEYDCPIYEDEEGRIIFTGPMECEFLKVDEEEHLEGR